jgi:predicted phage terminase large subunit-like protein
MYSVPPAVQNAPSEDLLRDTIQRSLTDWARFILHPEEREPAPHQRLLLGELEAICSGTIDRLMVLMPPGSAKSTYTSILFPVWWFSKHPVSSIIAVSHTASLGIHFGRQVRNLIAEHGSRLGYGLMPDNRAAGRWQTTRRGEYFVAGIRGPITGRRADLALIDDPIKSWAEVGNVRLRDGLWNWYRSELLTRLKPGGRIILVMTRWHEDDIAGRLQSQELAQWRVLRLPAFAEADDPLGRRTDAPLWPEWESASQLERKRTSGGERVWRSMYQQSPRPTEGGLFRSDRIEILDEPPPSEAGRVVRAWDLAATAADGSNDPDWTVGVKLQSQPHGRYVVLDIIRMRGSPNDVVQAVLSAAKLDGRVVAIGLPEDPGQAGKTQLAYFAKVLGSYRISSSRETGSKMTRAMPVASQIEARNFAIVRGNWNHAFLEELRDYPGGRKDDQVDALSRAFSVLTDADAPVRQVSIAHFAR